MYPMDTRLIFLTTQLQLHPTTDIPKKKNPDTPSNCKKNKRGTRDKRLPDKIPLSFPRSLFPS